MKYLKVIQMMMKVIMNGICMIILKGIWV